MQAIKDLVTSSDTTNHILGLQLAFAEYGKSFETFIMVLDWNKDYGINRDETDWLVSIVVSIDLQLYISMNKYDGSNSIFFLEEDVNDEYGDNLEFQCFFPDAESISSCIYYKENNPNYNSIYSLEKELRSIYHFLTYYDLI